jgi:hypothetical protein
MCVCLLLSQLGLGGELRSSKRLEERVKEALKLGFNRIIVPKAAARSGGGAAAKKAEGTLASKNVIECANIYEAVAAAFVNPEVAKRFTSRRTKAAAAPRGGTGAGGSGAGSAGGEVSGRSAFAPFRAQGAAVKPISSGGYIKYAAAAINDDRESVDEINESIHDESSCGDESSGF